MTSRQGVVALLVVSYGSIDLVERNLSRTRLPEGAMVVVVDNYTDAAQRGRAVAACGRHGWRLVAPDSNIGFGAGVNAAAAEAIGLGADVLVPLNPDAYIEGDGVNVLRHRILGDASLQLSPLVLRPDGRHFSSLMLVDLRDGRLRRATGVEAPEGCALWVSGACFAMSAEMWRRVGGFDDDFFLYWEDVDLSVRISMAGGQVALDPSVVAVHDPGGTQGESGSKSAVYFFYNARNRLVFAAKHVRDRPAVRSWVLACLGAARNVLSRGQRSQLLRPATSIVPVVRGTIAGLAFLRRSQRGARR